MGKFEQGIWGIIGAIVLALLFHNLFKGYSLFGALIGALAGYYFGRKVK